MEPKDLVSILALLAGHSGVLHLAPQEHGATDEPWYASLLLAHQGVAACFVYSKVNQRVLLRGNQALVWLANAGLLVWLLKETSLAPQQLIGPPQLLSGPSNTQQQPSRQLNLFIPQRQGQVAMEVLASWSRIQRQVFSLIDGKRNIAHIAALLSQPPAAIEQILRELQSRGVIQIRQS